MKQKLNPYQRQVLFAALNKFVSRPEKPLDPKTKLAFMKFIARNTNFLPKTIQPQNIRTPKQASAALESLIWHLIEKIPAPKDVQEIQTAEQAEAMIKSMDELKGAFYKTWNERVKEIKKAVKRPGGRGAKGKLNADQKRSVCALIGTYLANGMTMRTAQEAVAKEFHVSQRTVRRVWENRRQLNPSPLTSP